jgi:transposase
MRKIKEVLRLKHHCRLSRRQIAHSLNISRSTAADYLERAKQAGIGWPLTEELSDQELEQRLFPPPPTLSGSARPLPDCEYIYQELKTHKKFNLTLDLLWREYKEQHPDGYQYSQFCCTGPGRKSSITPCARITGAGKSSSSIMARD